MDYNKCFPVYENKYAKKGSFETIKKAECPRILEHIFVRAFCIYMVCTYLAG